MQVGMDILSRFAQTLTADESEILEQMRAYFEWQAGREVRLSIDDDVDMRTYLLDLQHSGVSRAAQRKVITHLRRFYDWAAAAGLVKESPFDLFQMQSLTLTREQIRKRNEVIRGTPEEREIMRLQAMNHLAEQLNRSADVQTALDSALGALVPALSLTTAWAFLPVEGARRRRSNSDPREHDFALAASRGLPPGLARDENYYLCRPPDCHCQKMLRQGQLKRAVNIVECTRLQNSASADGDNQGLLFHASVPIVLDGKAEGIINVATAEWQFLTSADLQLLSMVGKQASAALERARLYDLSLSQKKRLERELEMARRVQLSLLPQVLPEIPGYSFAAECRPAREMAGDFYDVFRLPDGRLGFVIADVSDKGAHAAMFMVMARSLIRARAATRSSPAETLRDVNQDILDYSSSGMFVTVFYGVLDAATRRLTYANAGHPPPLLRRTTGRIETIERTGPLLGVLDEFEISEARLTLASGDMLVAYSDGVPDALNLEGDEYGSPRLELAVEGAPRADAVRLLAHLSGDLTDFIGDEPSFDDITYMIVAGESGDAG